VNVLYLLSAAFAVTLSWIAFGGDARKEEPKVDGTWQASSGELAGKELPNSFFAVLKLTLKNGEYSAQAESLDRGTIGYDVTAKPKRMEIKGVEGPNKGKTIPAIYELSGDELKICYDLSGKSYPTEFKTRPGTRLFLVVYHRKKPDEAKAR
jgi:uncharacterized protein (TIGR03067 family)